jgi:DNA-binding MarR family transcriptional regulator
MRNSPSESTVRAWARLMKVQQKALGEIEDALAKAKLPPLSWYDVLLELERAGDEGLRPFALEREMLLAQYNLSRLIDRIEKTGYVERRACEDDGRGQVVAITASGKIVRRRMWPVYAQAIQSFLGDALTQTQIEMLDGVLGKLLAREGDR